MDEEAKYNMIMISLSISFNIYYLLKDISYILYSYSESLNMNQV